MQWNSIYKIIISTSLLLVFENVIAETDNNTGNDQLRGTWVTPCSQQSITDIPTFLKAEYEFTDEGELRFRRYAYDDNSCTSGVTLLQKSSELEISWHYDVIGQEILQEGIPGLRLRILTNYQGRTNEQNDVYAVIEHGRLCTSQKFRLLYDETGNGGTSTKINFDQCVIKGSINYTGPE